ncbi:MAG: CopD family protein [Methylovirgula sp.]
MENLYLWLKALHVVAVIAFMAGMLYLPRLFVYHAGVAKGSAESELFKVMERRLEKAIMRPAFIIVLLSGITLAWIGQWFSAGWFLVKLTFVSLLTVEYIYLIQLRTRFACDANVHTTFFYRVLNEIVTVILICIVIFAVVKPF